ncbi:hypothetical protein [Streptomyces sp. NPDC012466]|jgi:hypothetical protein|uniref:hypothetical protein n=1 Tax=Streptomyces sp. NPDC012466 TaxID=3364835 RepID=UPI0036E9A226
MTNGETEDDDRAHKVENAEAERAAARPFGYPHPERRAGVRATRHISREQADADSVPGVPGGYGTTSGGQAGGRGTPRPGGEDTTEESGVSDAAQGREPRPDRGGDDS